MLAVGTIGNPAAPVTIVEYASLTCPHCANFANTTFEALKKKYIDTGKVRFTYRDFPFDQAGLRAAMMARCAGPDRFFGFLAVLFKSQESWAGAKDPIAELAKIARLGGMGKDEFDACMQNQALMDGILKGEVDAQQQLKVNATPTFIINGVAYEGAHSLDEFDKILEPVLGGTGGPAPAPAAAGASTPVTSTPAAAPADAQASWWQRFKAYAKSFLK